MSEYQVYEFRAIDRPLSSKEMQELRALSSRAEITPTSFTNEYSYGDFRGDPLKLMQKYFDVHLYLANWGTRRFMARLPRGVIDPKVLAAYKADDQYAEVGLLVHAKGDGDVVLEFVLQEEEGGDWIDEDEGGDWLNTLTPVREALLGGDLRALYIGWLAGVQYKMNADEWGDDRGDDDAEADEGDEEDNQPEPPVPAGLGALDAAHKALAEFLMVDPDLLGAAALASEGAAPAGPSRDELLAWVGRLPGRDKDEWLVRVIEGDPASARRELLGRRREAEAAGRRAVGALRGPRTVGQLIAAAKGQSEVRKKAEAAKRARDKARREREAAAAREKHLDGLAGREGELWRQVESLVTAKPAKYDPAVDVLKDLRDLAARAGAGGEFAKRVGDLRRRYATRRTLLERLDNTGMGGPGGGGAIC